MIIPDPVSHIPYPKTMKTTSDIALVVFDMAGTTVHDEDYVSASFREALAAAGVTVTPDQVKAVMGYRKIQAVRTLLEQHKAEEDLDAAAIHDDFLKRMNTFYATSPAVREVEGASDAFRRLKAAGVRVALNTGFSRSTADVIIERLGWHENDLIDASVTSDEVARGRPHSDMLLHLMERTGIKDIRRVAKVGDTPSDLLEGDGAGCGLVIGVTEGSHTADQLRAYPHTHLIATVADLPALVLRGEPV